MSRLRRDRHRQRRRRRHARPPPRPVRQADPAARARRLAAARAAELGRPGRLRRQPLRLARTPGTTTTGKPFQPQVHYFVGGATKLYGAALYRLRAEDFGELAHHDGVSPAWPIAYDEMEPYYTLAEQLYQVHGARGEDPTEPPASAPYPFPAVSHEPRIQQLSDDLAAAGPPPVPRALRRDARRGEHAVQPLRALRHLRRLPVPRAREVRRRGARRCARRSSTRTSRCSPNAEAVRLETERRRHARSPAWWSSATARARPITGDIVVVSCGAANSAAAAARLRRRRAPGRAGQRLRPGRAQLHVPQQPGRARAVQGAEPDGVPEDARAQRLLLRAATTSTTRSATSRWSASPRRRCTAARSRCRRSSRPEWTLDEVAAHAVDFWLSTEDLPRPENRVTLRRDGQHRARLQADQRGAQEAAAATSSSRCSAHLGMHHDHLLPRHAYLKNEIPVAGVRAPGGHVPLRRRPRDVGARRRLPRARGRQPLRRRHELLPEHRRGQPGADRDGQRAARRRPHRSSASARRSASGSPRMPPETGNGQRHVVVVGGGFAGVGCAQRLAEAGRRAASRCSTATTTTSSSRCSTRWRPASSRRRHRLLAAQAVPRRRRTSTSSSTRSPAIDPATRTRHDRRRARVRAATRIVLAAGSQPNFFRTPGRGGARVPALLARRRDAAALADPRRLRGRRPRPRR